MRWVNQLQHKSTEVLNLYMSKISNTDKETTLLTPPQTSQKGSSTADSKLLAHAIVAIYTIGSLVIICPSASLKALVPTIHSIITSGSSDPKSSKLPNPTVSVKQFAPSLYLHSWLAMGKICLADGKLAKEYIPLFVQVHYSMNTIYREYTRHICLYMNYVYICTYCKVEYRNCTLWCCKSKAPVYIICMQYVYQELEKSDSATVRNNIVVMMADFCVRYTALVDW